MTEMKNVSSSFLQKITQSFELTLQAANSAAFVLFLATKGL